METLAGVYACAASAINRPVTRMPGTTTITTTMAAGGEAGTGWPLPSCREARINLPALADLVLRGLREAAGPPRVSCRNVPLELKVQEQPSGHAGCRGVLKDHTGTPRRRRNSCRPVRKISQTRGKSPTAPFVRERASEAGLDRAIYTV